MEHKTFFHYFYRPYNIKNKFSQYLSKQCVALQNSTSHTNKTKTSTLKHFLIVNKSQTAQHNPSPLSKCRVDKVLITSIYIVGHRLPLRSTYELVNFVSKAGKTRNTCFQCDGQGKIQPQRIVHFAEFCGFSTFNHQFN